MASLSASVLDLGLDEHSEVIERLLPAEITGLDRDGRKYPGLSFEGLENGTAEASYGRVLINRDW